MYSSRLWAFFGTIFVVSVLSTQGFTQEPTEPEATRQRLEDLARGRFEELGIEMSERAFAEFRDLIAAGVARLSNGGITAAEVDEAERNLTGMIDGMYAQYQKMSAGDTEVSLEDIRIDELLGRTFRVNSSAVGKIDRVVMRGGQPFLVVETGSFLGIGSQEIAIPAQRVSNWANEVVLLGRIPSDIQIARADDIGGEELSSAERIQMYQSRSDIDDVVAYTRGGVGGQKWGSSQEISALKKEEGGSEESWSAEDWKWLIVISSFCPPPRLYPYCMD